MTAELVVLNPVVDRRSIEELARQIATAPHPYRELARMFGVIKGAEIWREMKRRGIAPYKARRYYHTNEPEFLGNEPELLENIRRREVRGKFAKIRAILGWATRKRWSGAELLRQLRDRGISESDILWYSRVRGRLRRRPVEVSVRGQRIMLNPEELGLLPNELIENEFAELLTTDTLTGAVVAGAGSFTSGLVGDLIAEKVFGKTDFTTKAVSNAVAGLGLAVGATSIFKRVDFGRAVLYGTIGAIANDVRKEMAKPRKVMGEKEVEKELEEVAKEIVSGNTGAVEPEEIEEVSGISSFYNSRY